jgi:peroxiredoxin
MKTRHTLSYVIFAAQAFSCFNVLAAGEELIGTKAEEWQVSNWQNSEPLTLKSLEGKVVLVRWWTAPHCPYCAASAPALNEFHENYASKGLQVLGFYHHKVKTPLDVKDVIAFKEKMGFKFPIAIDDNWTTLKAWWLNKKNDWTSVSFLIDRKGVIRHIHPGGQYVKGDEAYAALKAKIEELLAEK